jgi:hypothetical protein
MKSTDFSSKVVIVFAFLLAMATAGSVSWAQTGVLYVINDKVGIGTDDPSYPLHIVSYDGTANLRVEETSETVATRSMFWLRNNGGIRFAMQSTASNSIWQFNALANFNIDFNGNAGNEFQVQSDGDIVAGGRVFANGGADEFPDYVFDEGYDLMTLDDLKDFIVANRHLPNVPSAEEIAMNGNVIDMTEVQLRLLEKVEELTLYILAQDERLSHLMDENELLAARLEKLENGDITD